MNKLEYSSLFQLTRIRFLLVWREPEAILLDLHFSHPARGGPGHSISAFARRMCFRWRLLRRN